MNLLARPPSFQVAPQPDGTSLTGAPPLQADAAGDTAYLAYDSTPWGQVGIWSASSPNVFSISTAHNTATDLTTASDGSFSRCGQRRKHTNSRVVVDACGHSLAGRNRNGPESPAPSAPPATGIHRSVDIRDAHNGQLRLRVYLPEALAMLNTDGEGWHGISVTMPGSGVQTGITAMLRGKAATVAMKKETR